MWIEREFNKKTEDILYNMSFDQMMYCARFMTKEVYDTIFEEEWIDNSNFPGVYSPKKEVTWKRV